VPTKNMANPTQIIVSLILLIIIFLFSFTATAPFSNPIYYLNRAPTIYYGLKRLATILGARFRY